MTSIRGTGHKYIYFRDVPGGDNEQFIDLIKDLFEENNLINLNDWIFGCDICQEVCPWNIKFSKFTGEEEFFDSKKIREKEYGFWETLSKEKFQEIFKNSAVKRTKYSGLKRNIITANKQKGI